MQKEDDFEEKIACAYCKRKYVDPKQFGWYHSCDFQKYCSEKRIEDWDYDLFYCDSCLFYTVSKNKDGVIADTGDTCRFCVQHMLCFDDIDNDKVYLKENDFKRIMFQFDSETGNDNISDCLRDNEVINISKARQILKTLNATYKDLMRENLQILKFKE